MLLLEEPFTITDYVRPACLPQISDYRPENGVSCVASGFGQEGTCDDNVKFAPTNFRLSWKNHNFAQQDFKTGWTLAKETPGDHWSAMSTDAGLSLALSVLG